MSRMVPWHRARSSGHRRSGASPDRCTTEAMWSDSAGYPLLPKQAGRPRSGRRRIPHRVLSDTLSPRFSAGTTHLACCQSRRRSPRTHIHHPLEPRMFTEGSLSRGTSNAWQTPQSLRSCAPATAGTGWSTPRLRPPRRDMAVSSGSKAGLLQPVADRS
jgi:hypothetical protein